MLITTTNWANNLIFVKDKKKTTHHFLLYSAVGTELRKKAKEN